MTIFQSLFFRIIASNREVYALKIITLAIAFACAALIILFSLNEFGYDKFHEHASSSFRLLQRNESENYAGNRLSNRIPQQLTADIREALSDSVVIARVQIMNELNVVVGDKIIEHQKIHAAEREITDIFSFEISSGALNSFGDDHTALLSEDAATAYFGTIDATGKRFGVYTLGDTIEFTVAGVYKNYPGNSHEEFNAFLHYDVNDLRKLSFQTSDVGVYVRILRGESAYLSKSINHITSQKDMAYRL